MYLFEKKKSLTQTCFLWHSSLSTLSLWKTSALLLQIVKISWNRENLDCFSCFLNSCFHYCFSIIGFVFFIVRIFGFNVKKPKQEFLRFPCVELTSMQKSINWLRMLSKSTCSLSFLFKQERMESRAGFELAVRNSQFAKHFGILQMSFCIFF